MLRLLRLSCLLAWVDRYFVPHPASLAHRTHPEAWVMRKTLIDRCPVEHGGSECVVLRGVKSDKQVALDKLHSALTRKQVQISRLNREAAALRISIRVVSES